MVMFLSREQLHKYGPPCADGAQNGEWCTEPDSVNRTYLLDHLLYYGVFGFFGSYGLAGDIERGGAEIIDRVRIRLALVRGYCGHVAAHALPKLQEAGHAYFNGLLSATPPSPDAAALARDFDRLAGRLLAEVA